MMIKFMPSYRLYNGNVTYLLHPGIELFSKTGGRWKEGARHHHSHCLVIHLLQNTITGANGQTLHVSIHVTLLLLLLPYTYLLLLHQKQCFMCLLLSAPPKLRANAHMYSTRTEHSNSMRPALLPTYSHFSSPCFSCVLYNTSIQSFAN